MSSVTFCCSQIVIYIYIVCVCVCVCVNQQTLWRWLCWLKGRELGGMGSIWATGKHMITNVKLPQTTFMFFQNLKSRLYDLSSGWKTQEEKIDRWTHHGTDWASVLGQEANWKVHVYFLKVHYLGCTTYVCFAYIFQSLTNKQRFKTFYLCLGCVNLLFESNPVFECFLIVFFI